MKLLPTIRLSLLQTIKEQPLLLIFTFITFLSVLLYSYTQVDLSLTLSRASFIQTIEKSFQYIGYFNRPLSGVLFLCTVGLMSGFYLFILRKVIEKKVKRVVIWTLIIFMVLLLLFSYNGFSYDLFNYIFDAKIVTHYHLNPYVHKALDFPSDPMLSFMHWTHRVYPYGPVWLLFTIPFSFLGFNIFIPTFFLFKLAIAASFLGMLYFIEKIALKLFPDRSLLTLTLIAFHPLMIIELLVSSHNDATMLFFIFVSVYLLVLEKAMKGFLFFIISFLTKIPTVFLAPAIIYLLHSKRKHYNNMWEVFFLFSGCLMLFAALIASKQTNFQPWYITWALPFFLMVPLKSYFKVVQIIGVFSAVMLLHYYPYLSTGNWDNKVPTDMYIVVWSGILLCYSSVFVRKYLKQIKA